MFHFHLKKTDKLQAKKYDADKGNLMAKKNFHYNYAFLFYDVSEKRVQKVFKICKKYLSHYQYSVFRGAITPSQLIRLSQELKNVICEKEDFVCVIKMMNENVFEEEIFGHPRDVTGEDLIL